MNLSHMDKEQMNKGHVHTEPINGESIDVGQIFDYINEIAPWSYAEDWDNVGLMLGSREIKVQRVLLCMDVTSDVISEAVSIGANVILSHHPFIFSKLKTINMDTFKGRQIAGLIKNNISIISAHTNLDAAIGGVNDTLAEAVGLKNYRNLKSYIPQGFSIDLGMGKVGELADEIDFDVFVDNVIKKLEIKHFRTIGKRPSIIKKVAVFCGSFDDDLESVKRQAADVLITGDIKYHTALDAVQMGLCILDVGHFASEHLILDKLRDILNTRFKNLQSVCSNVEKDPFIFA